MKKKIFPYILIVSIFVQLLAPFSVGLGTKNNLEVVSNKAEAEGGVFGSESGIIVTPIASVTSKTITLTINVKWPTNTIFSKETVFIGILSPDGIGKVEKADLSPSGKLDQSGSVTFNELQPDTDYSVYIKATQESTSFLQFWENTILLIPKIVGGWIGANNWIIVGNFFEWSGSSGEVTNKANPYIVTTLKDDSTGAQNINLETLRNSASFMPVCSAEFWNTIGGCVGIGLYKLIFIPSSFLFAKTGQLLDFTVGYSVRDQSYRSAFVVEGWGVLRDFCNMFFIFILLYIAFKTILGLAGGKTKEMIINVVIIGLLINFSLFATQVIIDASNILTRVFYNSETIKVGPKINGVVQEKKGPSGELKLSEALVSKVNPQNLIINASTVGDLQGNDSLGVDTAVEGKVSEGTFILVVLLASAINIVGLVVFLTCSLLFITRVIGLWMAMIFAPLAFFSYTIPKMQELEMVGWKKWWPNTLSLAFMAPVFVFFMYLIIMFLETGLGLSDASSSWNTDKIDFVLKTFVPFIFIMILLVKAKGIAVKMSGEMGEMVAKVGAAAGGLALAAATGGTAMAMRGTIGRFASGVANSEKLKEDATKGGFTGFKARMRLKAASGVSKSSFDVRNTKAGAMAGTGLGVDMGKAKEGGFKGYEERKIKRKIEDAKNLEMSSSEAAEQDKKAKNDPTHMTLTSAQENQRRKNEYAKNLGTSGEVNAAVSRELTKGQLSDEEVAKTTKSLATTEKELGLINTNLETLARSLGVRVDEITQTDINNSLKSSGGKEEQLTIKETEIIKWTAALNKDPTDANALMELASANIEKNKLKNEITETRTLINDRETYTSRQTQLKEKLKAK